MGFDPTGNTTFGFNIGFSFIIFGYGFSGCLSLVCSDDNFGVQFTRYVSDTTVFERIDDESCDFYKDMWGVDLGLNIGIQYTEKNNINELNGLTHVCGGYLFGGVDILTTSENEYLGWQLGCTTFSKNHHGYSTETSTIFELPTLNIPKRMKEWGGIK